MKSIEEIKSRLEVECDGKNDYRVEIAKEIRQMIANAVPNEQIISFLKVKIDEDLKKRPHRIMGVELASELCNAIESFRVEKEPVNTKAPVDKKIKNTVKRRRKKMVII